MRERLFYFRDEDLSAKRPDNAYYPDARRYGLVANDYSSHNPGDKVFWWWKW